MNKKNLGKRIMNVYNNLVIFKGYLMLESKYLFHVNNQYLELSKSPSMNH